MISNKGGHLNMLSNIKKRTEGFTIIEVLIVLAIAGLILLIVFLAVPALQRNSRNTQRKNDAAAILGSANEFMNNNNGTAPTSFDTANSQITGTTGTNAAPVKLGLYAPSSVSVTSTPSDSHAGVNSTSSVVVVTGYACNGNQVGAATPRSVIVVYELEPSAFQCQGS
jgi:prepilin-type N-terminal cleavage/methylation domain-containing protein